MPETIKGELPAYGIASLTAAAENANKSATNRIRRASTIETLLLIYEQLPSVGEDHIRLRGF
jgi:hypothetical protein